MDSVRALFASTAFYAAAWVVVGGVGGSALAQSNMPNIVYILADDMGLGDVRGYTPTSEVDTPNIDRLASAGMMFTNAHSTDSVCTPSRYGLLTGQYVWRTPFQNGVLNPFAGPILSSSTLDLPQMLKQSGYSTAMFGKWHLGETFATTDGKAPSITGSNVDFTKPITDGPLDRGFDTFLGLDGSANYPPFAFINGRQTVGSDLTTPTVPTGQVKGNPIDASNLPGPIAPGFNTSQTLQTLTTATSNYISSKANSGTPFFTYFALNAPHAPITPPASANSGYTGPNAAYANFVNSVDQAVGQVLDTINDPNHDGDTSDSIANNTLIVFTADNGASKDFSFADSPGKINGVPLRGDKNTIYEGGMRVPFVAQWAGHIPTGAVNNHPIELNDFMATAAAITGTTLPSTAAQDSVNILSELLGTATTPVRPISVEHSTNGSFAIHQVDSAGTEWKLCFTSGDGTTADTNKYDPTQKITDFTKVQLYNLTADPGEQTNLLSGGGFAGAQQKALQLQKYMQTYIYAGRSANIPKKTIVNGSSTELGESTMLVDFGANTQQTTQQGITWNNFYGQPYLDPAITKGLYDQGGGYTGIVMQSKFMNPGGSTGVSDPALNYDGPYPSQLAGISADALRDGFYVQDGNSVVITLSSLDAHATYDFQFYSGAKNFLSYTLFTANGSNAGQDSISAPNKNSTQVANIDGITADQFGQITITVEGRQPDGSLQNPNVQFDAGGQINFMQIVEHLQFIPGDYNGDRIVDSADYAAWRDAYGATGNNPADGNHDGVVDMQDYLLWRSTMLSESIGGGSSIGGVTSLGGGPNASSQPIPEPGVAALATLAVLICGGLRGRRQRPSVAKTHLA
ncbi:MAG TPA: sulfatase-like hydrolase/transferase [Lacipirellulaceae bacterium]|jgi:arylsulfatase A-like enzyme|nr:sulfatase-like hydrolase/transferase [Lacipirellulaceae bacterium]